MVGNKLDNESSDNEFSTAHSTATNNQNDNAETAAEDTSGRIVYVLNKVLGAAVQEHEATVRLAQQRLLFTKQGLHTIRQAQVTQQLCHTTNNNLEENYNHPEIHRLLSTSKQRRTKRSIGDVGDHCPDAKTVGKRLKTNKDGQREEASTAEADSGARGASGAADKPRVPTIIPCDALSIPAAGPEFNVIGGKENGENSSFKNNRGLDENCNGEVIQHSSYTTNSINEIINLENTCTLDSTSISQPTARINNDNANNFLARDLNSQHGTCTTSCSVNSLTASSRLLTSYRENTRGGEAGSVCNFKSASNSVPVALRRSQGSDGVTSSTLKPLTLKKTVQCTLSQSRQDRCLKERRLVVGNHYQAITDADVPLHVNCSRSKHTFSHHGYKYIWKAFVREAEQGALDCIKAVTFILDKSYAPHHVQTVRCRPFEIERSGWGEFSLQLTLSLHNSAFNRPVTLRHRVALGQELDALAHSGYWRTGREAVYCIRLFEPSAPPSSPSLAQRRPADLSHELQEGGVVTDRCQENITVEHSSDHMRPPGTAADRLPNTSAVEPLNVVETRPLNSLRVCQNGNIDVESDGNKTVPSSIEREQDSLCHLSDQPVNVMMNDSFNTSDINIDDTPLQNMTIPNFATEEITDFFDKLESESNENTMCDTFKEVMDRNSCVSGCVLMNSASHRDAGIDKGLEGSSGLLTDVDRGSLTEILNEIAEAPLGLALTGAAADCRTKQNNCRILPNSSVLPMVTPELCADTTTANIVSFDGAFTQNSLFDNSSRVISDNGFETTVNDDPGRTEVIQNTVRGISETKLKTPLSCDLHRTVPEDLRKGLKRKKEDDDSNRARLKPSMNCLPEITSLRSLPSYAAAATSVLKYSPPQSGAVAVGHFKAAKKSCSASSDITPIPATAGCGAPAANANIRQVTILPNSKLMTLPPGCTVAKFIGDGAHSKPNTSPRVVLEKIKLDAKGSTGQTIAPLVGAVKVPVFARNGSGSGAGFPLITLPLTKKDDLNSSSSSDEVQILTPLPPASTMASQMRLPIKIPFQKLPSSLIGSIQSKLPTSTAITFNSLHCTTSSGSFLPSKVGSSPSHTSKVKTINLGQLHDPKVQQLLASISSKVKTSAGSSANLSGLPLTTPHLLKIAGNSLVLVSSGGPGTSNTVTFTGSFTTVASSSMSATSTVKSLNTHIHSAVSASKSSVVASGGIVLSAPSVVARTIASNSITTVTTAQAASLSSSRVAMSSMSANGSGAGGTTIRVLPSNVMSSACISSTGVIKMSSIPNFPLGTKIKLEPSASGPCFQNRKVSQPELIRLDQSSSKIVIKTETGSAPLSQSQNVQLKNVGKPTLSGSTHIDVNNFQAGAKINTAVTKSDPSKDHIISPTKQTNGSYQLMNAGRTTSNVNLFTSKIKDILPTALLNGKHSLETNKEVNCGNTIGASLPFDVSNIKQEKVDEDCGSSNGDALPSNVMQPTTSAPSVVVQTPRSIFSTFPITSVASSTHKNSTMAQLKVGSNLTLGGGVSRTASGNLVISGGSKPIVLTQEAIAALMQQGVKISMPGSKLASHLEQKPSQVTLAGTAMKEAQNTQATLVKSGMVGARSLLQQMKVEQSSDGKVTAAGISASVPVQSIRMTPLVMNKSNTGKGVPLVNVIPNLTNSTSMIYNGQTYYSIGTLNKGTSTVKLNNIGDVNSASKMKGIRYVSSLTDLPSVLTAPTPLNMGTTIVLLTGQQSKSVPKILPRLHTMVDNKPLMSQMKLFDRKLTTGQLVSQGRLPTGFHCAPPAVATVDDDVEEISVDTAGLSKYRKNKIEEKQALKLMKNLPFLEATCRVERSSPSEHLRLWVRALPLVLPDSEASVALHYVKPRHGNCKPIKAEPGDSFASPAKRGLAKECRGFAAGFGLARKSTGVVGHTNVVVDANERDLSSDTVNSEPSGTASETTSGGTAAKVVDVLQTRLIIRKPKVTREQFLQWPVGKQRAHEFSRARAVVRYMRSCCQECSDDRSNWTVRAVVGWARQHGYTPCAQRRFLRTDAFPSEGCMQHEFHKRLLRQEPRLGGLEQVLGALAAPGNALLEVGDMVSVKRELEEEVAEEEPLPDEDLIWSWTKVFSESPSQKAVKSESEAANSGSASPSPPNTDPPAIKSEFPNFSSNINSLPNSLSPLHRNRILDNKPCSSSLSLFSNVNNAPLLLDNSSPGPFAPCSPKLLTLEGGCSWVHEVAGRAMHRLSPQEQLLTEERSVALGGRLVTAPPMFADTAGLVLFKAVSLFIEDLTRSSLSLAWGQQQRNRRRKPEQRERLQQKNAPTHAFNPPGPPSGAAADPRHSRPPSTMAREGDAPRRFKRQRGKQHGTASTRRDEWDRPASNNDIISPRRFAKVGRPSKEELRLRALQRSTSNARRNEPGTKYPSDKGKCGSAQVGRGRGKVASNERKRYPNNKRVPRQYEETPNGREAPNVQRVSQKSAYRFGRNNNRLSADHNSRTSHMKSTATVRNSSSTKPNNLSDRNSKIPRLNQFRARPSVSRAVEHLGAGNIPKSRPTGNARDEARHCSLAGKSDALKPLTEAAKSNCPPNCGPVKELHPRHVLFALERSRPQFQIIADKLQGAATVAASSSSRARPTRTGIRGVTAPPVHIKLEPL